jgi:hypothetical protein
MASIFLRDNKDLHTIFLDVKLSRSKRGLAREFVIDTLIPKAFPLTDNNPEHKDLLQWLYKMLKPHHDQQFGSE